MLVVITIMALITTTLLIRQSRFDSSTVLRSLAYSVALSVRQAQVYGTSVFGTSTLSSNCSGGSYNSGFCYAAGYGLYIDSGSLTGYTLFADLNNDGQYESSEAVKVFTLGTGYAISDFGATTTGTAVSRSYLGGQINNLTILFKRPNPDACIATSNSANACQPHAAPSETYASAYIRIQATGDPTNTKSVSVSTTGEVTVCATTGC